ncbi:PREDICTED: traB domain-containing protein isoform X2 [Habropoda laboriosa]|nr:PREDICTED: traB domain-containing protein isoform X2 [Habropoda laboriosa]XP_017794037.1 PREDICTED: traB domain-containing protein isoform X2 [Habropoda laboriosa]XP_017794038.1 PREDICTED: traB domain-containing protein isoform X2 [Habropoda laboriosa]XP_017794039.1 PREDICTED: traB domain-containing protein isoform X2 [Habropoda laboriosa]
MSSNGKNTSIEGDGQCSVVHVKNIIGDKYLYEKYNVRRLTENLIANKLQLSVQPLNASQDKPSVEVPSMNNQEEKIEDIVGVKLRFINDQKSNDNSNGVDASKQPQYDASIDERLPETVTLLTTPEGGKLYLVGTAHFSVESQNDVAMVIQAVQPDTVVVELCISRIAVMNISEEVLYRNATDLSLQNLKEILTKYGVHSGLLHILLYRMVAHVVKELGMAPGGEFRTAFEEAKKVPNCIIQLADRSINITLQRTLRVLSWWEIIKLMWIVARLNGSISKQDVEKCKRKRVIEEMINFLKEKYPAIERTFVAERDLFLTYHLQKAACVQRTAEGSKPPRVVGVVGMGHINGIVANWGKVKASDIHAIMCVPPKPLSSKILIFMFKASLFGAAIYVGYKVIPLPSISVFQSLKSSIEGLLM